MTSGKCRVISSSCAFRPCILFIEVDDILQCLDICVLQFREIRLEPVVRLDLDHCKFALLGSAEFPDMSVLEPKISRVKNATYQFHLPFGAMRSSAEG